MDSDFKNKFFENLKNEKIDVELIDGEFDE